MGEIFRRFLAILTSIELPVYPHCYLHMQAWQRLTMRFYRHLRVVSNISALMVATLAIAPYGDLVARTRDRDACPGALQLHQAADGALARVRLPGGVISPAQLAALAHAATRFGSPAMELTSRGNIQLRAITDTAAVAEIAAAAGLLLYWARSANPRYHTKFTRFYMRVWALFFLEYLLVPAACLAT